MFMLDTNAFNRTLDSGIDPNLLSRRGALYVTHIQLNELQNTKKPPERLDQLLRVFDSVEQESIPTSAAVWDVSEWGGAEYGSAGGNYDKMLARLNQLNGGKRGNTRDILIAVTALKHGHTLVTDDDDLKTVFLEFGGNAESFLEFTQDAR
jgi:predicted nucleic acid-binding protein